MHGRGLAGQREADAPIWTLSTRRHRGRRGRCGAPPSSRRPWRTGRRPPPDRTPERQRRAIGKPRARTPLPVGRPLGEQHHQRAALDQPQGAPRQRRPGRDALGHHRRGEQPSARQRRACRPNAQLTNTSSEPHSESASALPNGWKSATTHHESLTKTPHALIGHCSGRLRHSSAGRHLTSGKKDHSRQIREAFPFDADRGYASTNCNRLLTGNQ